MPEVTQICVGLEDKPGMFANLCGVLRRAEANVVALFVSDDDNCCWVNLVADPSHVAERALKNAGYKLFTEQVLAIELRRESEALERLARTLADHGINISYVYGSTGASGLYTLVLKVDDQARAAELLQGVHA